MSQCRFTHEWLMPISTLFIYESVIHITDHTRIWALFVFYYRQRIQNGFLGKLVTFRVVIILSRSSWSLMSNNKTTDDLQLRVKRGSILKGGRYVFSEYYSQTVTETWKCFFSGSTVLTDFTGIHCTQHNCSANIWFVSIMGIRINRRVFHLSTAYAQHTAQCTRNVYRKDSRLKSTQASNSELLLFIYYSCFTAQAVHAWATRGKQKEYFTKLKIKYSYKRVPFESWSRYNSACVNVDFFPCSSPDWEILGSVSIAAK